MKVGGDMRKTYTPGQYKKGQMIYQVPQQPLPGLQQTVIQNLPKEHNHGHYIQNQISPAQPQGFQPIYPNQPNQLITQPQLQNNQAQNKPTESNNFDYKKSASLMTVKSLANIPYSEYPQAEYSDKPFCNIAGYASNSYNGKVRNYNEDRTKIIVDFKKTLVVNGQKITPNISYFSVFDGHGGKACSDFLRDNLHNYLFNSRYFPANPIQAIKEAFIIAENEFYKKAYDPQRNALLDRSGSCALIILIINDLLYAINLGDCRALLSSDSGTNLFQITRDHKPNDQIEKRRIEKYGAKVYYANKVNINGKEVLLKEKDYGEGFTFPYRIAPGGISVSSFYF
jgi:protein phosphatase 2C family protein 2/3